MCSICNVQQDAILTALQNLPYSLEVICLAQSENNLYAYLVKHIAYLIVYFMELQKQPTIFNGKQNTHYF